MLVDTSGIRQTDDAIEAVGAEKCRSGQGAFSVSFVAPEDAQLEATAKAKGAEGTTDTTRDTASLELDGKACDKGVCSFKSKKGQSYALLAKPLIKGATTVCVTVARAGGPYGGQRVTIITTDFGARTR